MLSLLLHLDLKVTVSSLKFGSLDDSLEYELNFAVLLLDIAVKLLDLRHEIGAI